MLRFETSLSVGYICSCYELSVIWKHKLIQIFLGKHVFPDKLQKMEHDQQAEGRLEALSECYQLLLQHRGKLRILYICNEIRANSKEDTIKRHSHMACQIYLYRLHFYLSNQSRLEFAVVVLAALAIRFL